MIEVKDSEFQAELGDKAYIVDFHATWCAPCKAVAPILNQLAKDTGLPIYSVDIDDQDLLATKYGIRSVPTVMFFKGTELVDTVVGAVGMAKFAAAAAKLKSE